jgi:predicted transcriptional regulator
VLEMVRDRPTLAASLDRRSKQERLSVSVPADLAGYVRDTAERLQEPQSTIVAEALRRMRVEELRREIMEGLVADAEWHQELAREGMAVSATLPE